MRFRCPHRPCHPYLSHFAALRDPRQAAKVLYPLAEILLLTLCATISGADDFVEIHLWGPNPTSMLVANSGACSLPPL